MRGGNGKNRTEIPLRGEREKTMKKILCMLLAGTLLFALGACGTRRPDASASAEEKAASPSPSETAEAVQPAATGTGAGTSTDAEGERLTAVLDDIGELEIGTAGSSLKAAKLAAELLDWGAASKLSAEEIKAEVVTWLTPKGNDEQSAFAEKYSAVKNAVSQITGDNGRELLNEAGVTDSHYPWNDAALLAVKSVTEAILGED